MKKLITFLLLLGSIVSVGQGTLVFGTNTVEEARAKLKNNSANYTLVKVDSVFKIVGLTNTYDIKFGDATTITNRTLTLNAGTGVLITGGTQNLSANRSWTISLPQSISTSSSPEFLGVKLTNGAGLGKVLMSSSTGVGSWNYLAKADVGLDSVENIPPSSMPFSIPQQVAVNAKIAALTVENIAELRTIEGTYDGEKKSVLGYYSSGDDGEGNFYWDATSTTTDNGGTIFAVDGVSVGRWIRNINNGGVINIKWFGAKNDGTDASSAINAAINAGETCYIPAGVYTVASTINLPNNKNLTGEGMGLGSNYRTKILFTSDSVAIRLNGYYTSVKDLYIEYTGTGTKANSTGILYNDVTRTFLENVTILNFGTGIKNTKAPTTFTHLHRNVYVKFCIIGIDLAYFNNAVFDACFIESNGDNVILDTFFNAVFSNGCVIEIFGDERNEERNDSKSFKISNGSGFTIRDCYIESGTLAEVGSHVSFMEITNVKGLIIDGNYFNRSAINMLPMILFKDGNSSAVSITNNYVKRSSSSGNDYFVKGDTGFEDEVFKFTVKNNAVKFNMIEKEVKFTPVICYSNGSPADVTYSVQQGTISTDGNECTVNVNVKLTATSAIAGNLYIKLPETVVSLASLGADNEQYNFAAISSLTSSFVDKGVLMESGSNLIKLVRDFITPIQGTNLTSTTGIRFQITFPLDRQDI